MFLIITIMRISYQQKANLAKEYKQKAIKLPLINTNNLVTDNNILPDEYDLENLKGNSSKRRPWSNFY